MIEREMTQKYDFFISEHFPFGRQCLTKEILFLIEKIKKRESLMSDCRVVSGRKKYLKPF